MDYCDEMEWDSFGIPWSPTTCVELNLQIYEMDSNLLSMEVSLFIYLFIYLFIFFNFFFFF